MNEAGKIQALVDDLIDKKWRVLYRGKHYWAYPPDRSLPPLGFAKTPGHGRAMANLRAQLKARNYEWKS